MARISIPLDPKLRKLAGINKRSYVMENAIAVEKHLEENRELLKRGKRLLGSNV